MKKIILSIFALITLGLNAQGGEGFAKGNIAVMGGFDFNNTTKSDSSVAYSIKPTVMYMTTNNIGIKGGLDINNLTSNDVTVGATVGARYFFTPSNKMSFYFDGDLAARFPKNNTNFEVSISPGLNYFLNKNWALGAQVQLASLTLSFPNGKDAAYILKANSSEYILGSVGLHIMYVIK